MSHSYPIIAEGWRIFSAKVLRGAPPELLLLFRDAFYGGALTATAAVIVAGGEPAGSDHDNDPITVAFDALERELREYRASLEERFRAESEKLAALISKTNHRNDNPQ